MYQKAIYFVDENNAIYKGDIKVKISYLNSNDINQLSTFPGDFSGKDINGDDVYLDSAGAVHFEATDRYNNKLSLIRDMTIKIPSQRYDPNYKVWYYNERRSKWVEFSTPSYSNGAYTVNTKRGRWINVDRSFQPEWTSGVITRGSDPVRYATIETRDRNRNTIFTAQTKADGSFQIPRVSGSKLFKLSIIENKDEKLRRYL
jgi:hypothetical protein